MKWHERASRLISRTKIDGECIHHHIIIIITVSIWNQSTLVELGSNTVAMAGLLGAADFTVTNCCNVDHPVAPCIQS